MKICLPPPSPEKTQAIEAEKAKLKAERDMQDAFADALANAMLESDMPEHRKAGVRLLMKAKKVRKALNEIVNTYAVPKSDEEREKQLYPVLQEAYDFLEHIESSMNEFINSHPLPVDTRD